MHGSHTIATRFFGLDGKDNGLVSLLMFFVPVGLWALWRILVTWTVLAPLPTSIASLPTMRRICLAVLVLREILFGRWDRKTLVGLALTAYLAYAADVANLGLVRDTALVVFFGRNVPFKKIALFSAILLASVVVVVTACALTGVITDTVINLGGRIRHHAGFSHPNTGPSFAFFALVSWVAWRGKKFGLLDAAVAIAAAVTLFQLTGSRTSFALMIALAVLALIARWCPEKILRSKVVMILSVGSVAICALSAVLIAAAYDPTVGWMKSLDLLLSGRFALGHAAIEKYGFAVLPQEVSFAASTKYDTYTGTWVARAKSGIIVDCIYVKLCLSCGVPFLVATVALATITAALCFKKRQWHVLIGIGCVALFGVSETHCAYFMYNALLFLMGELFYSRKPSPEETARLLDHDQP